MWHCDCEPTLLCRRLRAGGGINVASSAGNAKVRYVKKVSTRFMGLAVMAVILSACTARRPASNQLSPATDPDQIFMTATPVLPAATRARSTAINPVETFFTYLTLALPADNATFMPPPARSYLRKRIGSQSQCDKRAKHQRWHHQTCVRCIPAATLQQLGATLKQLGPRARVRAAHRRMPACFAGCQVPKYTGRLSRWLPWSSTLNRDPQ